jgi:NAD+ synthase
MKKEEGVAQQLSLNNPQQTVDQIVTFLKETFVRTNKSKVVIAISGGIDSALSVSLLSKALPVTQIYPFFLPYQDQSIADSELICEFNQIPRPNWQEINIKQMVDSFLDNLKLNSRAELELVDSQEGRDSGQISDRVRIGNIMARSRMIVIYDLAKKIDALVCGTENKSEKYLGYFSRFGDEASDIEPIAHLYKTQVRQLANFLNLPQIFVSKAPSAGLWNGQTDEQDLGFSYDQADQVLYYFIDQHKTEQQVVEICSNMDPASIKKIIYQVQSMAFKHKVPYCL